MIETGEEFLEMMGTIVFLYVLLEYTQVQAAGQVGFQISDAEPVSAKQKEVVGEFSPVR